MSALRVLAALLLVACGTVQQAAAQDAGAASAERPQAPAGPSLPKALAPQVTSSLKPSTVTVGQLATLTIEVDAPSVVTVSLPEPSFGALELADKRLTALPSGERTKTTFALDLMALEPGAAEVPALTLRFVGPNGELGEVRTEPHALTVRSLIANEPNAAPKPATQPVSVLRDDYTLAYVALGLLGVGLVAGATLLIARWLRRRPKTIPPPPPPRPAWEVAFEKLQRLGQQREQLFAEERGGEFVDGVSDAVREYLGRRYGFEGLERTTGELLGTLEALRPNKLSLSGVALLLEQCDLVKFARVTPDEAQCTDLWNGAMGLVRATMPGAEGAAPRTSRVPGELSS